MNNSTIQERIGSFKTSMDAGALYFEFEDGFNMAIHKDLYEAITPDAHGNDEQVHKQFITKIVSEGLHGSLTKFLYNAYDTTQNTGQYPDFPSYWVDLAKIITVKGGDTMGGLNSGGILFSRNDPFLQYRQAYNVSQGDIGAVFRVQPTELNCVKYTDYDYRVHNINDNDGNTYDSDVYGGEGDMSIDYTVDVNANVTITDYKGILNIPIRDKRVVKVELYNINEPGLSDSTHLKNDIRVSLIAPNYHTDLNDCIVWIGGIFVDTIVAEDGRSFIIKDGKDFITTRVLDYLSEPIPKAGSTTATLSPDEDKSVHFWDFDIKIFKWRNIKVTGWNSPINVSYKSYSFTSDGLDERVEYVDKLHFGTNFDGASHLLMLDGMILDESAYTFDDGIVTINNSHDRVRRAINHLSESGKVYTSDVKGMIPSPMSYSLVVFSHVDPSKKAIVNRSNQCYKNFPYPFHVTFPEFVIGDIVLLDGAFEKYLGHTTNSIRYPLVDYMSRFNDKNILDDTTVTRMWISESVI